MARRLGIALLLYSLGIWGVLDSTMALDPMPVCSPALFHGEWGTIRLTPVLVHKNDTVTMMVTIVKPTKVHWSCQGGSWVEAGTSQVKMYIPYSFELVDYSPKADSFHAVKVAAGNVTWTSLPSEAPPNHYNSSCYCYSDYSHTHINYDGCPSWKPNGPWGPGSVFTLTLRTKSTWTNLDQNYWSSITATLWGNYGQGWSYDAGCYFKYGGNIGVSLAASPSTLPADGSASQLTATVMDTASGTRLPYQKVDFLGDFGIFSPASAETDTNGIATSSLSSPGVDGPNMVQAYVPNTSGTALVTFTHVDNPPDDPRAHHGRYNPVMPVADPVHPGLGNFAHAQKLFSFPGKGLPFQLEAAYNSLDNTYNGPMGYGWTHSYNIVLTPATPPSTEVRIKWGDGREDSYNGDGAGHYTPINADPSAVLTLPDPSHYLATLKDKTACLFDSSGRLVSITDLNGNALTFSHSTQLDRITDTAGRQIDFTYSSGRLVSIASPLKTGDTISFSYNGGGDLVGIVDPRGQTWQFTYDGNHRMLTQVDAKGTTILTNTYDGSGRVTQQRDGGNYTTTFEYTVDSSGTKTKVTPPSGNSVWHEYDLAFNLVKVKDGQGNSANLVYDSLGRLMSGADKKGSYRQIAYDSSGNPTLVRDRTGAFSAFAFNSQNRPLTLTDPLNRTTSFTYDAAGNLTQLNNAKGNQLSYTIGSNGLRTAETDFLGNSWTTTYNAGGLPITFKAPNNATTGLTYDAGGRITQTQLPLSGLSVQATYDASGLPLTHVDPLGQTTSFAYDANGNLTSRTFVPNNAITTFTYDWANRPLTITDPVGGVVSYTYDADGNVTTVTDPDGVAFTFQYDKSNRLTKVTDPLGHATHYGYDNAGNMISMQNSLGNTWSFQYDAESRLTKRIDPLGNAVTMAYDKAGQTTGITGPVNETTSYRYDTDGSLLEVALPNQSVVSYANDKNGRPLAIIDSLNRSWTYAYNNVGLLSSMKDPNGKTESYTYDAMGRITRKTLRDSTAIDYTYNGNNNITQMAMPGQTISYVYDASGNPIQITDPSGVTTMTYDKVGRLLSRTDPNGKVMSFTYTPAGRPASIVYPGSKTVQYVYDSVGRLATITDWRGNHTTFLYDQVNRITRINLPNGTYTAYTYDTAGRMLNRTTCKSDNSIIAQSGFTYLANGKISAVQRSQPLEGTLTATESSYSYDPVNRVLTATVNNVTSNYTFDLRGNLTTKVSAGVTTNYQYDSLNRLTSVTKGTDTTTYTYDGSGHRSTKTYNGTMTRYVRQGGYTYCTVDGTGAVSSYNIYAGPMLYSLNPSGEISVYHGDERGSILAVTNAAQNVVQAYAYDPYGKVLASSGSPANPFRFVGSFGVMMDENGLYHMQSRYYDPEAKRFISEDPLGLAAGLNLYGYVAGDPINRIDPQGLKGASIFQPQRLPEDMVYQGGGRVILDTWHGETTWGIAPKTFNVDYKGVTYSFPTHQEAWSYSMERVYPTNDIPKTQVGSAPLEFYPNHEFDNVKSTSLVPVEQGVPDMWEPHPEALVDPLEEGPISPQTEKQVAAWFNKGTSSSRGNLIKRMLNPAARIVSQATASTTSQVVGGVVSGFSASDLYLSQGKVWDSYDNSWKSWDQYQEDHPLAKAIWDVGTLGRGGNVYTFSEGKNVIYDWMFSRGNRAAYSYLDSLKKKPTPR